MFWDKAYFLLAYTVLWEVFCCNICTVTVRYCAIHTTNPIASCLSQNTGKKAKYNLIYSYTYVEIKRFKNYLCTLNFGIISIIKVNDTHIQKFPRAYRDLHIWDIVADCRLSLNLQLLTYSFHRHRWHFSAQCKNTFNNHQYLNQWTNDTWTNHS